MTANIFDEIDPSGKYLNFVRKFYRYSKYRETCEVPENNILYIYGYGCNGKTILFNCIGKSFDNQVGIIGYNELTRMSTHITANLTNTKHFLIKICYDNNSSKIIENAKKFLHIGFIIESNMDPDDNMRESAIIVRTPNKFKSAPFDYSKRVEEVKNAICGLPKLMD